MLEKLCRPSREGCRVDRARSGPRINRPLPLRDSGLNSSTENLSTARGLAPSNLQTRERTFNQHCWGPRACNCCLDVLETCLQILSAFDASAYVACVTCWRRARVSGPDNSQYSGRCISNQKSASRLSGARKTLVIFASCFNCFGWHTARRNKNFRQDELRRVYLRQAKTRSEY